jgi:hypothetical protein
MRRGGAPSAGVVLNREFEALQIPLLLAHYTAS